MPGFAVSEDDEPKRPAPVAFHLTPAQMAAANAAREKAMREFNPATAILHQGDRPMDTQPLLDKSALQRQFDKHLDKISAAKVIRAR